MKQVFKRPKTLVDIPFHFCPGCHHGIIHRIVAECIDQYGLREETIGVASVGCSVFLYDYFDVDVVEAPHGRAAAVATGVKRARPDNFVFTYKQRNFVSLFTRYFKVNKKILNFFITLYSQGGEFVSS